MNKIPKYISVLFLLLFARGCDFYSTSLWIFQENGLADETNPLTQIFGVGWNGLIAVNVIVIILIGYCYFRYTFRYKVQMNLKPEPQTYREYASILYYEQKNQLWKLLYKLPKNRNAAIAHTGHIAIWTLIFASFLAMVHNLLQFYDNEHYDIYLETVQYPKIIFYSVMFSPLVILSINLYKSEYAKYLELKSKNARMNNDIEQCT